MDATEMNTHRLTVCGSLAVCVVFGLNHQSISTPLPGVQPLRVEAEQTGEIFPWQAVRIRLFFSNPNDQMSVAVTDIPTEPPEVYWIHSSDGHQQEAPVEIFGFERHSDLVGEITVITPPRASFSMSFAFSKAIVKRNGTKENISIFTRPGRYRIKMKVGTDKQTNKYDEIVTDVVVSDSDFEQRILNCCAGKAEILEALVDPEPKLRSETIRYLISLQRLTPIDSTYQPYFGYCIANSLSLLNHNNKAHESVVLSKLLARSRSSRSAIDPQILLLWKSIDFSEDTKELIASEFNRYHPDSLEYLASQSVNRVDPITNWTKFRIQNSFSKKNHK